jgi:putative heme-binding domain-containing protein
MRARTIVAAAIIAAVSPAKAGLYVQTSAAQQRFLPAEIDAGGRLYLANCTGCHGPEGDGVAGVNFSQGKFRRGQTDDELIRIIVRGIPGTPMPPSGIPDNQVATIVAYLRSMTAGSGDAANGDAARGRTIVEGKGQCLNCHSIGVNGLHAGPALSDIGAFRRSADLMRSLVDPAAEIRPENRSIRVMLKDGRTLNGRFLNQDTFSIQLIDSNDKLLSVDKSTVRESTVLTTSPMPSFKDKLSAQELADVVAYLSSLKGRP